MISSKRCKFPCMLIKQMESLILMTKAYISIVKLTQNMFMYLGMIVKLKMSNFYMNILIDKYFLLNLSQFIVNNHKILNNCTSYLTMQNM
jgi:hypothetical protein